MFRSVLRRFVQWVSGVCGWCVWCVGGGLGVACDGEAFDLESVGWDVVALAGVAAVVGDQGLWPAALVARIWIS